MTALNNHQNNQRGIVLLALLVLVVLGIVVAAFLFVARANKDQASSSVRSWIAAVHLN